MAKSYLLTILLLCIGCSSDSTLEDDKLKVIMVFDMAGIGDRGFNDMGWAGIQRAIDELGVSATYIQSSEQADYVPNLSIAAEHADVVVAMGFLMIESLQKVAPLYPQTKFLFVDGEVKGENVASFDFKSQEGAFLAGILAGMTTKTGKVGCVMGMDIPPVRTYEVGFRAGLKVVKEKEGKTVAYLSATIGDFNDPARGKALAQGLIGRGCDIVLQLAGNSGLGVIEAVKEAPEGVYAIGADMDQDDLAPGRVLTSILKRIDVAVFEAIRRVNDREFVPGHHLLGLKDDASKLSSMSHTRDHIDTRTATLQFFAREWILQSSRVPDHPEALDGFDGSVARGW
ncbi:MAG TPA: BMP family ABC transporter substrate-binding protein [Candidatus Latescibacteria bacterium]|jgi:basic membrane protein A|nr:BMP family ABC transporter substrate-binding protein [Candidatus Latescibacterota bacterium]